MNRQDDGNFQQPGNLPGQKQRPEADSNYIIQQQKQQYYLQQQIKGQDPRKIVQPGPYSQHPSYYPPTQRPPVMPQDYQNQMMMQQHQQMTMQQQQMSNQNSNQLIGPIDIKGLTQKISTKEVFDNQVEKTLAHLADDFVKTVAEFSCKLAKHRGSETLEKEDIKFAIEKLYNISIPIKPNLEKQSNQALTQQVTGSSHMTSNYKNNIILTKKANEQSGNI
ncbi:transcription initiation factor tfiid subunit 12 [Stylonychia lemnae]|uniref:Transcription initiation factor tfiid subunit 12 n=1 Tax=Stylonychia lemnae TaxID=5949 RepID=A0A078A9Q3_STYLE|nr:transcription initiation factor tfiid subunit 12 [Stylonychia lemnae]|eukprot:CDW79005.1 transcription initiation factor tfiid subunit 12 [Stylonychia lemnae]